MGSMFGAATFAAQNMSAIDIPTVFRPMPYHPGAKSNPMAERDRQPVGTEQGCRAFGRSKGVKREELERQGHWNGTPH